MFTKFSTYFSGQGNLAPEKRTFSSTSPQQKLLGYYDLVVDIIGRAGEAEHAGQWDRSFPLYGKALEVIDEALKLDVPSTGLLPKSNNVVKWKADLQKWGQEINRKLHEARSGRQTAASTVLPRAKKPKHEASQSKSPVSLMHFTGERRTKRQNITPQGPLEESRRQGDTRGGNEARNVDSDSDKYRKLIMGDILLKNPGISWSDIAGLKVAKQALYESVILPTLRADLFQGLRAPPRGLLLYGPPVACSLNGRHGYIGNGKTFLAKALASEARATFFNISASSLTSKWVGDGEKLVRALFQVANENQPSIIFIDEIDSILSARTANENDAMRRLKTEILIQFDGVASGDSQVVVIGATNRPQELDDAARRRLVKRIYIPLPDTESRQAIITHLFENQAHSLRKRDVKDIVMATEGYSASDLTALCKEAAMVSIRELGMNIQSVKADKVRPVKHADFVAAFHVIKPSVNSSMLKGYEDFTREFGTQ